LTPQKLAIIDLDGTLLKGTSAERSFFFFLVFRAKLGPVRLARFTLTFLKDVARLGFRRAVGTNIAYLRGETPEQVDRWAAKYAGRSLAEAVPAFLRLKLAVLKSEGYRLILLSGSLQVLVELFKEALGADLAIGQQIEVVGGRLTPVDELGDGEDAQQVPVGVCERDVQPVLGGVCAAAREALVEQGLPVRPVGRRVV